MIQGHGKINGDGKSMLCYSEKTGYPWKLAFEILAFSKVETPNPLKTVVRNI